MLCFLKGACIGLLVLCVQHVLARVAIPVSFGYQNVYPSFSHDLEVAAAEHPVPQKQPLVKKSPLLYELGSPSDVVPKTAQKPRAFSHEKPYEQAVAYIDQHHAAYEEEPVYKRKQYKKNNRKNYDGNSQETKVNQREVPSDTQVYYDSYGSKINPDETKFHPVRRLDDYQSAEEEDYVEITQPVKLQIRDSDNPQKASQVHEKRVKSEEKEPEAASSETKKVEEQETSNSDHHEKHDGGKSHHEQGGGKKHHSEHHEEKGDEGEKKYEGKHASGKAEHGHHDKHGKKGHYKDEGGHKKKHHDEHEHHHEHHKGDEGHKGAKYGEKGEHNKGHSTKGEHNIHKKDEYEKKHEFYDEDHEGGEHEKEGGYHEHHDFKKGGHEEHEHHKGGHEKGEHGEKKHHEEGHHYDEHKHHDESEGDKKHHDHEHKEHHGEHKKHGHKKSHHHESGGGDNHGHGSQQQAAVSVKKPKDVQAAASISVPNGKKNDAATSSSKDKTYIVAVIKDDKKDYHASPSYRSYTDDVKKSQPAPEKKRDYGAAFLADLHKPLPSEISEVKPAQEPEGGKQKLLRKRKNQGGDLPKLAFVNKPLDEEEHTREDEKPQGSVKSIKTSNVKETRPADSSVEKTDAHINDYVGPRKHRQAKAKSHGVHGCGP